jgi:hypothetical protein
VKETAEKATRRYDDEAAAGLNKAKEVCTGSTCFVAGTQVVLRHAPESNENLALMHEPTPLPDESSSVYLAAAGLAFGDTKGVRSLFFGVFMG